jgi:hypothetical protein
MRPQSRGAFSPGSCRSGVLERQRAQGKPVRRSHPRSRAKNTRGSHHRYAERAGLPCAMVLRLIARSPRGAGLDSPRRPARRVGPKAEIASIARLDPSVGGPGPHAFAVRIRAARLAPRIRPSHPASTFVTIAKRPSQRRRDGEGHTPDLRFWKSEIFFTEGLDAISENQPSGKSVDRSEVISRLACPSAAWMVYS